MPSTDKVYQWCHSWISLKAPPAASEVERLQANSKFFRGMVTGSVITTFFSLTLKIPFHWIGAVCCTLLACMSFLRYSDLRWKAVQQTYRYFIALASEPSASAGDPGLESPLASETEEE